MAEIRKTMIDFEESLHERMMALANGNNRTFKDEVMHACERHLAKPPKVTVIVDTPEADDAEIEVPAKPKAKRGRPRKDADA